RQIAGPHGAAETGRPAHARHVPRRSRGTGEPDHRRGRHGAGLAHAARCAPPRGGHVRAAVAARGASGPDRHDRPQSERLRRVRVPARSGLRGRGASGRRFRRPLQRPAHRTPAPNRRLLHRGDEQRAARDRRVHAHRRRRIEASLAHPLRSVTPIPVAVLVSGGGTNLQALLDALHDSPVARIARVIASGAAAGALERARRAGVRTAVLAHPDDPGEVVTATGDAQLVVLAGYLKRIPAAAVAQLRWRVINIHPALLPAFGGPGMYGRRVHSAVLASGVALSGATVHYVDEEYDRGPIIAQWPVPVR